MTHVIGHNSEMIKLAEPLEAQPDTIMWLQKLEELLKQTLKKELYQRITEDFSNGMFFYLCV